MIFSNIAKASLNVTAKRFARRKVILKSWPNDWVPFHWNRPEKVPGYLNTGDLVETIDPPTGEPLPEVRISDKLRQLKPDDPLKKIFTIEHARRSKHNKALVYEHLNKYGLVHAVDYTNSLEAKIINLTFTLRHLLLQVKNKDPEDRFNGPTRMSLNSVKFRRFRYLCELREQHNDRFERIKKVLNIEPEENRINVPVLPPFRKLRMRQLAIEYSRDLKEKKVEEFIKQLETEKERFKAEKAETLRWIEEKEKELGSTSEVI